MRLKRKAATRRTLDFYHRSFRFGAPYKILLDLDFLFAAKQAGLDLAESIDSFLGVPTYQRTKIFLSNCILEQLRELCTQPRFKTEWKQIYDDVTHNKRIKLLRCTHEIRPLPPHDCIMHHISQTTTHVQQMVDKSRQARSTHYQQKQNKQQQQQPGDAQSNENQGDNSEETESAAAAAPLPQDVKKLSTKTGSEVTEQPNADYLILAAQHSDLRKRAREAPGVPICFIMNNFLLMEEPSHATKQYAGRVRNIQQHHAHNNGDETGLDVLKRLEKSSVEAISNNIELMQNPAISRLLTEQTAFSGSENVIPITGRRITSVSKKKGPKVPNPSSCKKPKPKQMPAMSKKRQFEEKEKQQQQRQQQREQQQQQRQHQLQQQQQNQQQQQPKIKKQKSTATQTDAQELVQLT